MDHGAQRGDQDHQDHRPQDRVSVGGDGLTPGSVEVLLGVGEEKDGEGGEAEKDGGEEEERGRGRGDLRPAETDLGLDLVRLEGGEGEDGVEERRGQAGGEDEPGGGQEVGGGGGGEAGEDDEGLQQEEDPAAEVGDVEAGHGHEAAHLVL